MEYRRLPHGDEQISVIGLGTSSLGESDEAEIISVIEQAMQNGINYIDLAAGHAKTFEAVGKAIKGKRDQVYLQIHFGALYDSGAYGWSTDPKAIKKSIAWQLEKLGTDTIDFGFIHCLDEAADLEAFKRHGIIELLLSLKEQGIVKHLGLSSHTPALVHKVLDMNLIDMVMFSINPAYDNQYGDYAIGENNERMNLYRRCEKEGVAISVMKPFCGGQLLDAKKSPFHHALSEVQCIQYALDKPAVVTVLPGVRNLRDLQSILNYLNASDEARDYSVLGSFEAIKQQGKCVYCKHCHPCPAGIDIALINKYYDLALLDDELAKDHYHHLAKKASDCIQCAHCNTRCPFRVNQMDRMKEISAYFGE